MRIWIVRMALLLLSLLSVSLIARNALVQRADEAGSTLPVALIPDDSVQVLLRNRLLQVDLLKAAIPKRRLDAATKAATRADPLDFRPFLIAGLAARKADDLGKAADLLTAARQRQPRNFNIRRLLMEVYLIDNRYDAAAREILASTRLNASDIKPLMQALALFGGDPTARKALGDILAKRADWRIQFATNINVVSLAPDLVFEVANNPATPQRERLAIVQALVSGRQIELAYMLWTQSFSHTGLRKGGFPTDPGFDGWAQSSGFGWKFAESSDGVAELVEDGRGKGRSLDVEYFGGGAVPLVEQPILLTPGAYSLSVSGSHIDGQEGAGDYRWTITCQGDPDPIAVLRVASDEPSKFAQSSEFAVPDLSCPVQLLRMAIIPGEMSVSMRGKFSNIGIAPR